MSAMMARTAHVHRVVARCSMKTDRGLHKNRWGNRSLAGTARGLEMIAAVDTVVVEEMNYSAVAVVVARTRSKRYVGLGEELRAKPDALA